MKKYIAGFRSDKKRNKIIASIYYVFMGIVGISENLFTLAMLWILPSLILNFTRMLKNNEEKKENKKIFIKTLVVFIVAFVISANLSSTGSSNKQDDLASSSPGQAVESKADDNVLEEAEKTEKNEVEQTNDIISLEIGDKVETPLGTGEIRPVYNGVKTTIIGKYITISSTKNIKEEDLIKFTTESYDKLKDLNWIVVEFGDGTALDLSVLPFFNYCYYNYEDGFTNTMGTGVVYEDRVEYSTDL